VHEQVIFPGRFQPPHRDHVAIAVRAAHELGRPYWLGIVVDAPAVRAFDGGEDGEDARFAASADPHHEPDRNPLSFPDRQALWNEILRRRLPPGLRPFVVPLLRPETCWAWIAAAFPGPRAWIVPECGDPFDDEKAAFFRRKGDRVLRPRHRPTTDGRIVRALLAVGSPDLAVHVSPEVVALVAGKEST
jgi:hypothetical protein